MRVPTPVAAILVALAAAPAGAAAAPGFGDRIAAARDYAGQRAGRVSFAVVDERGRTRGGLHVRERHHSASVVKAMLMVAYLNRPGVRGRALNPGERSLIGRMIRHSYNRPASRVRDIVGNDGLRRLARRAAMQDFATAPSWGSTTITARDQARFFFRIDRLVVRRHRAYAREQLAGIVRSQRWGIPRAVPAGWTAFFKGGWRREAGRRLVHQAALIERGRTRIALAILTDGNPSYGYGTRTVEGVARRLLAP
jgi:hypothetical protein